MPYVTPIPGTCKCILNRAHGMTLMSLSHQARPKGTFSSLLHTGSSWSQTTGRSTNSRNNNFKENQHRYWGLSDGDSSKCEDLQGKKRFSVFARCGSAPVEKGKNLGGVARHPLDHLFVIPKFAAVQQGTHERNPRENR